MGVPSEKVEWAILAALREVETALDHVEDLSQRRYLQKAQRNLENARLANEGQLRTEEPSECPTCGGRQKRTRYEPPIEDCDDPWHTGEPSE